MVRALIKSGLLLVLLLLFRCPPKLLPQDSVSTPFNTSGSVVIDGQPTPYLIRHLPVSSFPELPAAIQGQLNLRGCLIPQTYEAHRPENVVHASLERPGSSDWAVLCSARGTVSLLVFFGSGSSQPTTLSSAPETERLQTHDPSGVLGFSWGIDPASPQQVHEGQLGMRHPSPRLDHDALADTLVDRHTVYHFYLKSAWIVLEMQD
ncbi:MAG: hypothetical protein ABSD61_00550 [Terracidiphilus sp.]|jgi:hypothetical protein